MCNSSKDEEAVQVISALHCKNMQSASLQVYECCESGDRLTTLKQQKCRYPSARSIKARHQVMKRKLRIARKTAKIELMSLTPSSLLVMMTMEMMIRDNKMVHMESRRTRTRVLLERRENETRRVFVPGQARDFHAPSLGVGSVMVAVNDAVSKKRCRGFEFGWSFVRNRKKIQIECSSQRCQ